MRPPTTTPPPHTNLLVPGVKPWPRDQPMIVLDDVSLSFGDHRVLSGVNLKIRPGQTTVIIGRSGSGKSVLLKLMIGLLAPTTGRVELFGRDLASVSAVELLELRKRMGMLFQNYALFDALSVEDNIGFTLRESSKLPDRDIARLSRALVEVLGLSGSEALLPGALSGGMKKRVSLARALVGNPEVVLFDEPTTGLDPIMVERVDRMILLAKQQYQITSVIISHDLASVKRLADRIAFLHAGTIIFEGTYDELMASELPPLRAFLGEARAEPRVEVLARTSSTGEAPIVELVDVHKRFGDKRVLRGVDLAILPRRITVVIGASGSGKSVIAKHIMGLLKPDRGQVLVFGKDVVPMTDVELAEIRTHFGLVFQHAGLLDWLSVEDNIAFPLVEQRRTSRRQIRARVREILARLELERIRHRLPGTLSLGERKRVALARAIVTQPEILIYDEPTTGQDPQRTHEIDDMIEQTQERFEVTSLVISHDMPSTFRIAHRIALLHEGKIAAYGTPAELRATDDAYVQHFLRASFGD